MASTPFTNENGSLEILANNPETRPKEWVALGDSFAAGPGAGAPYGEDVGCKRGQNSYPPKLQEDANMRGPNPPPSRSKPRFNFKACTGDVTQDLTDENNPNYQLGAVSERTSFLTLSIGGNNIGFSKILKRCVYGLGWDEGTCDFFIAKARDILYSREMYDGYNKVLNTALEKLTFEQRAVYDKRTALYQTGYPQFFDSFTTQCNGITFLHGYFGPKMVQELRRDLNRLTHELNYVLQYWMDIINVHHTTQTDGNPRYFTALDWVDTNLLYSNHRFCRRGVVEPARSDPNTWFFHLGAGAGDGTNAENNNTGMDNVTEAAIAKFNDTFTWEGVGATSAPMWVTKTFHPTSAGHRETKQFMIWKLHYDDILKTLAGVPIDIMVVGDMIPAGGYNPQSQIYQGFRGHLRSILLDRRILGRPMPHTFVGSQSVNYVGYLPHECYPDANLTMLYKYLRKSPRIEHERKVVLLLAGTKDMLYNDKVADAPIRLVKIIDLIFDRDPGAVVLVGQIPMIGFQEDGSTFNDMNRRVISYNAAIAAIVSRMFQEQGRRILKVHTSTTTWEHQDVSFVGPNGLGYLRMAYDFLEGIALANSLGWLHRRHFPANATAASGDGAVTATPASGVDAVTAGSAPSISTSFAALGFNASAPTKAIVCSQPRPTDAPDYNNVITTLFGGLSQSDFTIKVACNETAVCQNSPNSNLPDLTQPVMNNGSTCVWASESKSGESNYYQLVINRPNTTSPLASTICPLVMEGILNTCFLLENSYSGYWGAEGLSFDLSNLNFPGSPLDLLPSTTSTIPLADQSSLISSATPAPASATIPTSVE